MMDREYRKMAEGIFAFIHAYDGHFKNGDPIDGFHLSLAFGEAALESYKRHFTLTCKTPEAERLEWEKQRYQAISYAEIPAVDLLCHAFKMCGLCSQKDGEACLQELADETECPICDVILELNSKVPK
jgi:hypothetical protein